MKKTFVYFFATLLMCATNVYASSSDINIVIDNKPLKCDTPAQIIDNRTMVPLRAIFESLGTSVDWNSETKTITAQKNENTIVMCIDQADYTINGIEKTLDVPAMIIDNRTMVPLRAVSEAMNCNVEWNGDTKTVVITTSDDLDILSTETVTEKTTEKSTEETTEESTETTTILYSDFINNVLEKYKENKDIDKSIFYNEAYYKQHLGARYQYVHNQLPCMLFNVKNYYLLSYYDVLDDKKFVQTPNINKELAEFIMEQPDKAKPDNSEYSEIPVGNKGQWYYFYKFQPKDFHGYLKKGWFQNFYAALEEYEVNEHEKDNKTSGNIAQPKLEFSNNVTPTYVHLNNVTSCAIISMGYENEIGDSPYIAILYSNKPKFMYYFMEDIKDSDNDDATNQFEVKKADRHGKISGTGVIITSTGDKKADLIQFLETVESRYKKDYK